MNRDEYLKRLLDGLAKAESTSEVREVIKKANTTLTESYYSLASRRDFFEKLIQEAQDNSATMANAGEAQEIVNQILNGAK